MSDRKILLDSHSFVWLAFDSNILGVRARDIVTNAELYLSVGSLYELTIKFSTGKLPHPPEDLLSAMEALYVNLLPITPIHLKMYPRISLPNKDPFDRLFIAQSEAENMHLLTADATLLTTHYNLIDARL